MSEDIEHTFYDDFGHDYQVMERRKKFPIICDGCDKKINKGEYYGEADAGEIYCLDCMSE